jgi:pimeloyl-ACP methyl ester carboxylesterase
MSRVTRGLVVVLLAGAGAAAAQAPGPVPERDYITGRIADLRKISTPEGIEALEEVPIGGSRQWISIRGLNRANPVLLMIHGGPGSPTMPISWAFQTPWEDFFTVVQWDQRGVGKNFLSADTTALGGTLTVERMVDDTEEMVAHLRKRLEKDRIVVLGYSWGSELGLKLAMRRPEWLYAYVGVGQAADTGEKDLYQRLLDLARGAGNQQALSELEAIAPYPSADMKIESIMTTRKWARVFNGGWYGRPDFNLYFALPEWAPEYSQADVSVGIPAIQWAERNLVSDMFAETFANLTPIGVPVLFLMGRHDLHTPYVSAKALFDRIQAPKKRFITFERSAHFPMFEEPGRFLLTLVEEVLPLTGAPVRFSRDP